MSGRPTKLDDLTAKRIVDALEAGNSRLCAAQTAGISYSTLKSWLANGRRGDPEYLAFLSRVERAESKIERELVTVVVTAAKDDPKLALEWLSRRRRATWARQDNAKKPNAAPGTGLEELSDAEVEQRTAELVARLAANGEG